MSKILPVWDFVVGTLPWEAMLNMGWILPIFSYQCLYSNEINNKGQMTSINSKKGQKLYLTAFYARGGLISFNENKILDYFF